eukprot:g12472.t1
MEGPLPHQPQATNNAQLLDSVAGLADVVYAGEGGTRMNATSTSSRAPDQQMMNATAPAAMDASWILKDGSALLQEAQQAALYLARSTAVEVREQSRSMSSFFNTNVKMMPSGLKLPSGSYLREVGSGVSGMVRSGAEAAVRASWMDDFRVSSGSTTSPFAYGFSIPDFDEAASYLPDLSGLSSPLKTLGKKISEGFQGGLEEIDAFLLDGTSPMVVGAASNSSGGGAIPAVDTVAKMNDGATSCTEDHEGEAAAHCPPPATDSAVDDPADESETYHEARSEEDEDDWCFVSAEDLKSVLGDYPVDENDIEGEGGTSFLRSILPLPRRGFCGRSRAKSGEAAAGRDESISGTEGRSALHLEIASGEEAVENETETRNLQPCACGENIACSGKVGSCPSSPDNITPSCDRKVLRRQDTKSTAASETDFVMEALRESTWVMPGNPTTDANGITTLTFMRTVHVDIAAAEDDLVLNREKWPPGPAGFDLNKLSSRLQKMEGNFASQDDAMNVWKALIEEDKKLKKKQKKASSSSSSSPQPAETKATKGSANGATATSSAHDKDEVTLSSVEERDSTYYRFQLQTVSMGRANQEIDNIVFMSGPGVFPPTISVDGLRYRQTHLTLNQPEGIKDTTKTEVTLEARPGSDDEEDTSTSAGGAGENPGRWVLEVTAKVMVDTGSRFRAIAKLKQMIAKAVASWGLPELNHEASPFAEIAEQLTVLFVREYFEAASFQKMGAFYSIVKNGMWDDAAVAVADPPYNHFKKLTDLHNFHTARVAPYFTWRFSYLVCGAAFYLAKVIVGYPESGLSIDVENSAYRTYLIKQLPNEIDSAQFDDMLVFLMLEDIAFWFIHIISLVAILVATAIAWMTPIGSLCCGCGGGPETTAVERGDGGSGGGNNGQTTSVSVGGGGAANASSATVAAPAPGTIGAVGDKIDLRQYNASMQPPRGAAGVGGVNPSPRDPARLERNKKINPSPRDAAAAGISSKNVKPSPRVQQQAPQPRQRGSHQQNDREGRHTADPPLDAIPRPSTTISTARLDALEGVQEMRTLHDRLKRSRYSVSCAWMIAFVPPFFFFLIYPIRSAVDWDSVASDVCASSVNLVFEQVGTDVRRTLRLVRQAGLLPETHHALPDNPSAWCDAQGKSWHEAFYSNVVRCAWVVEDLCRDTMCDSALAIDVPRCLLECLDYAVEKNGAWRVRGEILQTYSDCTASTGTIALGIPPADLNFNALLAAASNSRALEEKEAGDRGRRGTSDDLRGERQEAAAAIGEISARIADLHRASANYLARVLTQFYDVFIYTNRQMILSGSEMATLSALQAEYAVGLLKEGINLFSWAVFWWWRSCRSSAAKSTTCHKCRQKWVFHPSNLLVAIVCSRILVTSALSLLTGLAEALLNQKAMFPVSQHGGWVLILTLCEAIPLYAALLAILQQLIGDYIFSVACFLWLLYLASGIRTGWRLLSLRFEGDKERDRLYRYVWMDYLAKLVCAGLIVFTLISWVESRGLTSLQTYLFEYILEPMTIVSLLVDIVAKKIITAVAGTDLILYAYTRTELWQMEAEDNELFGKKQHRAEIEDIGTLLGSRVRLPELMKKDEGGGPAAMG